MTEKNPSHEKLNSEIPWPNIWEHAKNLTFCDNEFRSKGNFPGIADVEKYENNRNDRVDQYEANLKTRHNFENISLDKRYNYRKNILDPQIDTYRAQLEDQHNSQLYGAFEAFSSKLLSQFIKYLDSLQCWKNIYTTEYKDSNGIKIHSFDTKDSLYYLAANGSSLRIKNSNLGKFGLSRSICFPMEKTFFAEKGNILDLRISDGQSQMLSKTNISVIPKIGYHVVDQRTKIFESYVERETLSNEYIPGIQVEDNGTNWKISILDELSERGFHKGHAVNKIIK